MKKSFAIVAALFTALSAWAVTTGDYAKHFTVTMPTDLGGQTFENFPVLVRLSPEIDSFTYSDFKEANGADMIFTDADGNILSHEIDTWNEEGESLVWVKAPVLMAGTVLHCYFRGPSSAGDVTKTDVWSDYAGVWHFSENVPGSDIQAGLYTFSKDSTANGLNATNGSTTAYVANGVVGSCRRVHYERWNSKTKSGEGIYVPSYDNLELGGTFTISGWFWMGEVHYYDYFFARRSHPYDAKEGFTVKGRDNPMTAVEVRGATGGDSASVSPWTELAWYKLTVVYDKQSAAVYTNGCLSATFSLNNPATDNGEPLAIGSNNATFGSPQASFFNGNVDEVRLIGSVQTPERIAAEYAMETNPEMLTYSAVTDVSATLALIVAVLPEGMGNPVPAGGRYMAGEVPSVITSGTNYFANGVCYKCSEYMLEVSSDNGGTWSEPVLKSGSDMSFEPSDKALRVTWIWKPHASRVTADANRTSAKIVFGSAPYAVDETGAQYFQIGTTVTATALDETSLGCRMWLLSDGTTVSGEEFSFAVGGTPVSAMAVLDYPWAYVATKDEAGNTVRRMTDGEWVFRSDLQSNGFGLKELLQAAPSGVLAVPTSCTNDSRGVTLLANQLFKNSTALKILILPETELSLEGGTFSGCTSLERVEPFLPATVTFTGTSGYCFNGCTSLTGDLRLVNPNLSAFPAARNFQSTTITSVYAPYLTRIREYEFQKCTSLTNVVLSENLVYIDKGAFSGDSVLAQVTPFLPDTLTALGTSAFENCPLLGGDLVLGSVERVEEKTFNNTALTSVEAPAATNVQKFAFVADSTLRQVTFGAESVDFSAYQPISMKTLGEIYLPGKAPTSTFGTAAFGWSSYKTIVYCDPVVDPAGWASFMADPTRFRVAEEGEKTAKNNYPGSKTLGLILTTDDRLYWLVKYKSPLRKPGMVLLVR